MFYRESYKTKLCTLYHRGHCPRQICSFSHGSVELRRFSSSRNGKMLVRVTTTSLACFWVLLPDIGYIQILKGPLCKLHTRSKFVTSWAACFQLWEYLLFLYVKLYMMVIMGGSKMVDFVCSVRILVCLNLPNEFVANNVKHLANP